MSSFERMVAINGQLKSYGMYWQASLTVDGMGEHCRQLLIHCIQTWVLEFKLRKCSPMVGAATALIQPWQKFFISCTMLCCGSPYHDVKSWWPQHHIMVAVVCWCCCCYCCWWCLYAFPKLWWWLMVKSWLLRESDSKVLQDDRHWCSVAVVTSAQGADRVPLHSLQLFYLQTQITDFRNSTWNLCLGKRCVCTAWHFCKRDFGSKWQHLS